MRHGSLKIWQWQLNLQLAFLCTFYICYVNYIHIFTGVKVKYDDLGLGGGGASVVWHQSLLLRNSFNKTEAAIFPMQAILPQVKKYNCLIIIKQFTKYVIMGNIPF